MGAKKEGKKGGKKPVLGLSVPDRKGIFFFFFLLPFSLELFIFVRIQRNFPGRLNDQS